jgi:hypothetical protein
VSAPPAERGILLSGEGGLSATIPSATSVACFTPNGRLNAKRAIHAGEALEGDDTDNFMFFIFYFLFFIYLFALIDQFS